MGRGVFGDDLGGEALGRLVLGPVADMAAQDQGDSLGRPSSKRSETAASNRSAPARLVEHSGVAGLLIWAMERDHVLRRAQPLSRASKSMPVLPSWLTRDRWRSRTADRAVKSTS
jgi:hypothetical protein